MQARKGKGFCNFCEEQYSFGHKCKKPQLFMMVAEEESNEVFEEALNHFEPETGQRNETAIDVGISLTSIIWGNIIPNLAD